MVKLLLVCGSLSTFAHIYIYVTMDIFFSGFTGNLSASLPEELKNVKTLLPARFAEDDNVKF